MEKRTIGILFGGASSEHDVSLMSATSVLENIDCEKYDVIMERSSSTTPGRRTAATCLPSSPPTVRCTAW